ncbi:MAG: MarR family winged helix-turn-helix transcriptional regulator [Solirubrobacteraceae bacterium]
MSSPIERPPALLSSPTYLTSWVAKRARADVQVALAEHGLATSDYGVLVALADFGPLSQQQLADRLDADKSHVVRLIDQLERRGLVTRAADPSDRRRHRIALTDAGGSVLRAASPATKEIEAAQLQALSASERRTLATLLQRVLASQDNARAGQGRR